MGLISFWRTQAVTLGFSSKRTFAFAQAHDRLIDCQDCFLLAVRVEIKRNSNQRTAMTTSGHT